MKKAISFIHAADLHLDSPFKGLSNIPEDVFAELRNSTFKALDNLIEAAILNKVDFVLLVGDLFDNDKQSLKAQIHLKEAFERLQEQGIQVYVSYGNHDHLNGNKHPIKYPENVHIFQDERVGSFIYERDGVALAEIYGFSYENRAVMEDKTAEYPEAKRDGLFSIGMLHGSLNGDKSHDPYAPFSLRALEEKGYDYWALGHIHKGEVLSSKPAIIYPGNTQGRHRNEAGVKGCYYISMSEDKLERTFIETQSIIFESIHIDLATCETRIDIEQQIRGLFEGNQVKKLVHLTFTTTDQKWGTFDTDGGFNELIELLNERLLLPDAWVYIYTYKLVIENIAQIDYGDFFLGELMKTLDDISIKETITDLYQHPQARRYLEDVSEEEIREEAKQYLLHELLRVEGSDS